MEQHLTQYRIFYAVARAGNISRAAKELFISQPAISKSISKLEESLGIALFIRNSRGVSLTAEGQVLFQHVEAAFEALERGENELRADPEPPTSDSSRSASAAHAYANIFFFLI